MYLLMINLVIVKNRECFQMKTKILIVILVVIGFRYESQSIKHLLILMHLELVSFMHTKYISRYFDVQTLQEIGHFCDYKRMICV